MAFYGVASNLVVYLTTQLREETVASVRNVNNWTGAVWMTPIVGAYIADTFLGRFWTFTISSLVYLAVSYTGCACCSPGSEFPLLILV